MQDDKHPPEYSKKYIHLHFFHRYIGFCRSSPFDWIAGVRVETFSAMPWSRNGEFSSNHMQDVSAYISARNSHRDDVSVHVDFRQRCERNCEFCFCQMLMTFHWGFGFCCLLFGNFLWGLPNFPFVFPRQLTNKCHFFQILFKFVY